MTAPAQDDPRRAQLVEHLTALHGRAGRATSWQSEGAYLTRLAGNDGHVSVRKRLSLDDIAFLAHARADLGDFAEIGLRLLALHRPRDGGGITSDVANPIWRCRSCMWRWPCPTFRVFLEVFGLDKT
ncbi:MAG: hypothetical protein GEV11_25725 [Streptosporangiales bacterium]|nr:hypothetical protein [Streptosporangiales bacterium]